MEEIPQTIEPLNQTRFYDGNEVINDENDYIDFIGGRVLNEMTEAYQTRRGALIIHNLKTPEYNAYLGLYPGFINEENFRGHPILNSPMVDIHNQTIQSILALRDRYGEELLKTEIPKENFVFGLPGVIADLFPGFRQHEMGGRTFLTATSGAALTRNGKRAVERLLQQRVPEYGWPERDLSLNGLMTWRADPALPLGGGYQATGEGDVFKFAGIGYPHLPIDEETENHLKQDRNYLSFVATYTGRNGENSQVTTPEDLYRKYSREELNTNERAVLDTLKSRWDNEGKTLQGLTNQVIQTNPPEGGQILNSANNVYYKVLKSYGIELPEKYRNDDFMNRLDTAAWNNGRGLVGFQRENSRLLRASLAMTILPKSEWKTNIFTKEAAPLIAQHSNFSPDALTKLGEIEQQQALITDAVNAALMHKIDLSNHMMTLYADIHGEEQKTQQLILQAINDGMQREQQIMGVQGRVLNGLKELHTIVGGLERTLLQEGGAKQADTLIKVYESKIQNALTAHSAEIGNALLGEREYLAEQFNEMKNIIKQAENDQKFNREQFENFIEVINGAENRMEVRFDPAPIIEQVRQQADLTNAIVRERMEEFNGIRRGWVEIRDETLAALRELRERAPPSPEANRTNWEQFAREMHQQNRQHIEGLIRSGLRRLREELIHTPRYQPPEGPRIEQIEEELQTSAIMAPLAGERDTSSGSSPSTTMGTSDLARTIGPRMPSISSIPFNGRTTFLPPTTAPSLLQTTVPLQLQQTTVRNIHTSELGANGLQRVLNDPRNAAEATEINTEILAQGGLEHLLAREPPQIVHRGETTTQYIQTGSFLPQTQDLLRDPRPAARRETGTFGMSDLSPSILHSLRSPNPNGLVEAREEGEASSDHGEQRANTQPGSPLPQVRQVFTAPVGRADDLAATTLPVGGGGGSGGDGSRRNGGGSHRNTLGDPNWRTLDATSRRIEHILNGLLDDTRGRRRTQREQQQHVNDLSANAKDVMGQMVRGKYGGIPSIVINATGGAGGGGGSGGGKGFNPFYRGNNFSVQGKIQRKRKQKKLKPSKTSLKTTRHTGHVSLHSNDLISSLRFK